MCIVVVLLRDHDRCCGEPRTDVLFTRPLLWRTGYGTGEASRAMRKTDRPARHSASLEKIKQLFQSNDCI
ncbi:hypothetical protein LGR51_19230 [Pseudomonas sp. NP21570]|uniref:hypothetical protein n=1 Tax=Stutzerimonas kunmingensis TaxID=1211807 RepID=UPI0011136997|nr:hypothetical protein [Stutzerimonas kunmingensis]MCB4796637.1 hypothetical protein [Pseudomonas sp. NP21570]MCQ2044376.1 hypothetical protein [Stutzerimonas kunmingensis]